MFMHLVCCYRSNDAITDIGLFTEQGTQYLVCTNLNGEILLHGLDNNNLTFINYIKNENGAPITCLQIHTVNNNLREVICGDASGHVTILHLDSKRLERVIVIAAHTRCINAIAVNNR